MKSWYSHIRLDESLVDIEIRKDTPPAAEALGVRPDRRGSIALFVQDDVEKRASLDAEERDQRGGYYFLGSRDAKPIADANVLLARLKALRAKSRFTVLLAEFDCYGRKDQLVPFRVIARALAVCRLANVGDIKFLARIIRHRGHREHRDRMKFQFLCHALQTIAPLLFPAMNKAG